MKISNKKIIVSTLALAMGAALAGSISGSVAWYQYSTRATAQLTGTTAGVSRNLKIKTNAQNTWGWDVSSADIKAASAAKSASTNGSLKPVAATQITNDVPGAFVSHAVRQYPNGVAADATSVIKFDLSLRSIDEKGLDEVVPIYLETLKITSALDQALRISVTDGGSNHFIWAKTEDTTTTKGYLDLNGDGVNDRAIFEADDRTGLYDDNGTWKKVDLEAVADGTIPEGYYSDIELQNSVAGKTVGNEEGDDYPSGSKFYKLGSEPAKSTADNDGGYIEYVSDTSNGATNTYATKAWSAYESDFTDAYTVSGTKIADTTNDPDHPLTLSFVIWLEGWGMVGESGSESNMWSESLAESAYSIQMRFQTIAEEE